MLSRIRQWLGLRSEAEEEAEWAALSPAELSELNRRRARAVAGQLEDPEPPQLIRAVSQNGLGNLGNSCFMGAALQCVLHIEELNRFFASRAWLAELNTLGPCRGRLALAHCRLAEAALARPLPRGEPLDGRDVLAALARAAPAFAGHDQHDAQEFLATFLDLLHEDVNRVLRRPPPAAAATAGEAWQAHRAQHSSRVQDVFFGQFGSRTECPACGHRSAAFEPFNVLSLNLPQLLDVECYFFPLTYARPFAELRLRCDAATPVAQLVQHVKEGLSLPGASILRAVLREKSFIDVEISEGRTSLDGLMASSSILFVDEVFEPAAFGLVFGEKRAAELARSIGEDPYALSLCSLTFSVFHFKERKSVERRLYLPADTTVRELYELLFLIHRSAAVAGGFRLLDAFAEPPGSAEQLALEMGLQWPGGAFHQDCSPFVLVVADESWEELSRRAAVFEAETRRAVRAELHLNARLVRGAKLKAASKTAIADTAPALTLPALLESFAREETLDSENAWHCPGCSSRQRARRRTVVTRLPPVLVVHLKRFRRAGEWARHFRKNDSAVECPLEELGTGAIAEGAEQKYRLFGVVGHLGTTGSGHYTACCRGGGGPWLLFDDEQVAAVEPRHVVDASAYLLFYQRLNSP